MHFTSLMQNRADAAFSAGQGLDHADTRPLSLAPSLRSPVIVDLELCRVSWQDTDLSLAPREFDLLHALLDTPGRLWTRAALLQEVWQYKAPVLTRTVDYHIGRVRAALRPTGLHSHILTIQKRGYPWRCPTLDCECAIHMISRNNRAP